MYDLEKSIADWRRQMFATGINTPVPLEELEIHLREDIERQIKSGLNEQKAFEIAAGKIGQAGPLKQEFQKISGADKARRQKRAGGIFFAVILGFYSLFTASVLYKGDFTFNERLSGFASVATILLLIYIVWKILPKFFPVITNKAVQSAIGIIGGISGVIWFLAFACFILPHCNFTLGQLQVAIFWAIVPALMTPTTAFLVIEKSEQRPFTMTSS
jgi:hypothetical protein